jgi:hypothetical protein
LRFGVTAFGGGLQAVEIGRCLTGEQGRGPREQRNE